MLHFVAIVGINHQDRSRSIDEAEKNKDSLGGSDRLIDRKIDFPGLPIGTETPSSDAIWHIEATLLKNRHGKNIVDQASKWYHPWCAAKAS